MTSKACQPYINEQSPKLLKLCGNKQKNSAAETAAGERWAGRRTTFAEEDAAGESPQAVVLPPKHAPSAAEAPDGTAATGTIAAGVGGAASPAAVLTGVKWKKLAAKALAEARKAPRGLGSSLTFKLGVEAALLCYQSIVWPLILYETGRMLSVGLAIPPHNACTVRAPLV